VRISYNLHTESSLVGMFHRPAGLTPRDINLSSPHIICILIANSGDTASIIGRMIVQQASNPRSAITIECELFVLANASAAIDR
jgi:hypothetical protein